MVIIIEKAVQHLFIQIKLNGRSIEKGEEKDEKFTKRIKIEENVNIIAGYKPI